ncbi:MAG: hypothetical protein N2327_01570 [Caldimicrobium sp.]|nr:hypothetical protein [Caldimicrobium sp.]
MSTKIKVFSLVTGFCFILGSQALAQKKGPMATPPVDHSKLQELCKELQPLYQQMVQLRSEVRAQIWSTTPNWDIVLEKEIEAVKIRVEIMKKVHEKGLTPRLGYGKIIRACGLVTGTDKKDRAYSLSPAWRW